MIHGLDLFSGYGGVSKALEDWVVPVSYCEVERYAQPVLLSRMFEGDIRTAPIWDDVKTLDTRELPFIDIIYGGFPCQDISVAGAGKGLSGDRSGLVSEIFRLLDETKAPFLFLENVPNIRTKGAETISKELAERGYGHRWCMLSASDVGAPHKRERWFLLAYSASERREQGASKEICKEWKSEQYEKPCYVSSEGGEQRPTGWPVEPDVGRVVNGLKFRMDRIKALGNGVVPKQVKRAYEILMYGEKKSLDLIDSDSV